MLAGKATWVKVGMTLFYAEGPACLLYTSNELLQPLDLSRAVRPR